MDIKLFDSELKVMSVLWREGDTTAKHISDILKAEIGWNMNTTYTLIKRCIKKGAIERSEPNFMCHALIPKEEVQEAETNELINKIYDGSADKLFAALLGRKKLTAEQIERLKQIVGDLEGGDVHEFTTNEHFRRNPYFGDCCYPGGCNQQIAQKNIFGLVGHRSFKIAHTVFCSVRIQCIFLSRTEYSSQSFRANRYKQFCTRYTGRFA